MAKKCTICGKSSLMVWKLIKLRGKYNPTKKNRKYPNLQKVLVPTGIEKKQFKPFIGKRIVACAKCIKTIGKRK